MADVLIADDSGFTRALLRDVLGTEHRVVGEVENGVEAVEVCKERRPDLVVMDAELPIRDGIEATEEITTGDPEVRVLVCTDGDDEDTIERAMAAGADGYVTRPFRKTSVMEEIRDVVPS